LLAAGADISTDFVEDFGQATLQAAIEEGHEVVVERLKRAGVMVEEG
jgi:hypothetical protein